jgi:uncharacterized surface protein with fasciclin (FAS1) repeats
MKLLFVPAFALILAACTHTATQTPTPNTTAPNTQESAPAELNIVETAVSAGSFTTLVKAVEAAGLVETLSGPGPFTVFAPTDEAFAKIDPATLNAILADKEKLTAILTYHVVSGEVMAADVVNLTSATTVQGSDVSITTKDGGVMINDANVVTTDIKATNGVIHVIDTVLLPQ